MQSTIHAALAALLAGVSAVSAPVAPVPVAPAPVAPAPAPPAPVAPEPAEPGSRVARAVAVTSRPSVGTTDFAKAPPEIRAFLLQAEKADAIADPLARCLAFPDLPGNKWPAGLVKAHCELRFGPRITLAKMTELVDRGAFAELDALFVADLARHFDEADFSEIIHRDFDDLQADYATGRLTQKWLDAAPDSPWAQAARAIYYEEMGTQSRGGKYVRDTPSENLARMHEYNTLAEGLYRKALATEPRLMPAWIGLMNIGLREPGNKLQREATRAAMAIDPACLSVTREHMHGLEPRWGGSYPEMIEYARELAPYVAKRPLVALWIPAPAEDLADYKVDEDDWAGVVELMAPVVPYTTLATPAEHLATALQAQGGEANKWQALMYFLHAGRFYDGSAWMNRARGRLLKEAGASAWAIRYLQPAVAAEPGESVGHYLLGEALMYSGRYAEAEPELMLAIEDPKRRVYALADLVRNLIMARSIDKARKYAAMYRSEYPDEAIGWHLHGMALAMQMRSRKDAEAALAALHKYLELTAASTDPGVVWNREKVRKQVETMERDVLPKLGL